MPIQKAYVPTTALASNVEFDAEMIYVHLNAGRII